MVRSPLHSSRIDRSREYFHHNVSSGRCYHHRLAVLPHSRKHYRHFHSIWVSTPLQYARLNPALYRVLIFILNFRFTSGTWIALIGSIIGQMGGIEDMGRRIGVTNTIAGIGTLCGPPISGLFESTALGYTAVGYFAGMHSMVFMHFLRLSADA